MSGPMQWNQALGKLVPAITSAGDAATWTSQAPESVEIQPSIPKSVTQKPAPQNILSLAKARLREVKAELRRLKALEKERGELERLIAAAEDKKPRAVVREIKRSAG